MNDLPFVRTPSEFNQISDEKEWGLSLRPVNNTPYQWQLERADGTKVFQAVREMDAVRFAIMQAGLDRC